MTPIEEGQPPQDRDVIIILAGVMGWRLFESGRGSLIAVETTPDGWEQERILFTSHPWESVEWNPLESISQAFEMEAKILDTPFERAYLLRLYDSVAGAQTILGTTKLYRGMVHASPRQRCMAAYEAVKGKTDV